MYKPVPYVSPYGFVSLQTSINVSNGENSLEGGGGEEGRLFVRQLVNESQIRNIGGKQSQTVP